MAGWLTALRIARREARRAKGRSALVVALIGLPALALTFAAVSYDMFTLTPEERLARDLGTADAQLRWWGGSAVTQMDVKGQSVYAPDRESDEDGDEGQPPTEAELRALPGIERVLTRWEGGVQLTTAAGIGTLQAEAFNLTDPLVRGIVEVTDGRAPDAPDEVAITVPAATRLGATVGDEIALADNDSAPGSEASTFTVTGLIEFPDRLSDEVVVFHPEAQLAETSTWWLVATSEPVTWDQVTELNQHGLTVYSRAVALDPPPDVQDFDANGGVDGQTLSIGMLVGGLAILEIVLLAGPAFAVGARRRQRDLALVAVAGGTPAHLRRIVLADGLVLGVLGAGAGLLLGVAAGFAARPLVEEYLTSYRAGGYRVFPMALAGIAAAAVVTGVLAALVPAFTAARQQVVAALAGHRGGGTTRKRWLALGLALTSAGAAVTGFGAWRVSATMMLAGLVLAQLGLVLCTPFIVGLVARLGSRLPLAARIALRDTARNRSAAAPAISAVMAAVAGAAAAGVVTLGLDQSASSWAPYPNGTAVIEGPWEWPEEEADAAGTLTPAEAVRAARATLPADQAHQLSWPDCAPELAEDGCALAVVLPPENRCPYWDAPRPLSRADQRAARQDSRCDDDPDEEWVRHVVDDRGALAAVAGADPGELAKATAVLRDGGVVVTDERLLSDGMVSLQLLAFDRDGDEHPAETVAVPGELVPTEHQGPTVIAASSGAVQALGMEVRPGPVLVTTTRVPTQAEEDAFTAAAEELGAYGWVAHEFGSELEPMLVLLAVAAGSIALGAAAIATGLAAADRRADLSTLGAVGASPRVRRNLSLSQSGVIAGLGTALGLVAGLGAAIAVLVALNQRYASTWPAPDPYPITVPWLQVAALLAVPLVAMLGAGLLTRSRLPIERRLT